ncbi:hypothetical protein AU106_gp146 [Sinorhizobium phage phiM9]|uniref:Uncharacterized protein n=1 Tax=Sinorhizobium phage phiM9 TaxID=1636182 RepID=A0A0F6R520_9CAUD|nr:hypothetical protein AU106_gp146 [Sinorhizobium phage phiM9]AKE44777.1 hypothetical protein Sm_phiM9_149 [Sinorhizobium phage phiM9]
MTAFAMTRGNFGSLTSKQEFDDYVVSWTEGGRIKVQNLKTQAVSFYDYSKKALMRILEACSGRYGIHSEFVNVYFNPEAYSLMNSDHVEILHDESAVFFISRESSCKNPGTWKINSKDNKRQIHLKQKYCSLRPNSRYELQSDGELVFLEEISVENLFKKYEGPVVSVYSNRTNRSN